LSLPAGAKVKGLPPSTLRDAALRGEIPIVRFGRRLYLKRSDLDALIEQHTERVR
jgi:excisionase family DNA binding protein